jgi:hypothetical protein
MGRSQVLADPLFLESERFDFEDGDERMLVLAEGEGIGVVEVDIDRMRRYRDKATLRHDLHPATYWRPTPNATSRDTEGAAEGTGLAPCPALASANEGTVR